MPTFKQKKLAKAVLENLGATKPKTKGEVLKEAGYSQAMVKNPQMVFSSVGLKIAIDELLDDVGFDKNSRLSILAEIANARNPNGELKDKRAVIAAIAEGNKMVGDYAPVKQQVEEIITNRNELFIVKPE